MPSSQQGVAPGTRDVVRELREHKRLIDILFRRLSNPPKAAAPSGAAVIGNAEAASSTYTADNYGVVFHSWTLTTHDYWPGDGAPTLVAVSPTSDEFDPADAGWYVAQVQVTVYVSGVVPAFARVEVNPDATHNTDSTVTDVRGFSPDGSSSFVQATVTTAPFYHPGPGVANHFLGTFVTWPGTPGVVVDSASVSYILTRVR